MLTPIVVIGALLILIFLAFLQRKSCTFAAVYQAIMMNEPFNHDEQDDGQMHLENAHASILYRRTDRPDHAIAETINIIVPGYTGGIVMTFVDDNLVTWTHNAITQRNPVFSASLQQQINEIRTRVRHHIEQLT